MSEESFWRSPPGLVVRIVLALIGLGIAFQSLIARESDCDTLKSRTLGCSHL